jgi:hypothetical protein
LDLAVEATREFKSTLGIDVYVETMKNVLREADLGSTEKILKLALSAKNVKDRLEFSKMQKYWIDVIGGEWFLVKRQ